MGIDNPIRVAAYATSQLIHVVYNVGMAVGDEVRLVLVAAVAGNIDIISRMTDLALDLTLSSVIKGEAMCDQLRRGPCLSCMAVLALQPEETGMDCWLEMAGGTLGGRTNKLLTLVAANAF